MNEEAYKKAVKKAIKLVKAIKDARYEVAKIAISVCDIKTGGGTGKNHYTITSFAKDIGINPNTLHRWRREYLLVISKIGDNKIKRMALDATLKRVDSKTPPSSVRKIYVSELKKHKTEDDTKLEDCLKRVKTIQFLICHQFKLDKMNKETLLAIKEICLSIDREIDERVIKNKPRKKKRDVALQKISHTLMDH